MAATSELYVAMVNVLEPSTTLAGAS